MKVLLAVDPSPASENAVLFVGKLLGGLTNAGNSVTLFHVVEPVADFIWNRSQANDDAYRKVVDEWTATQRAQGEKLLSKGQQILIGAGLQAACVKTKLIEREALPEARRVVAALAIIEEMKAGDYDVVVLARRSTSATIETSIGSVAEKVLRQANGKTVWIVD